MRRGAHHVDQGSVYKPRTITACGVHLTWVLAALLAALVLAGLVATSAQAETKITESEIATNTTWTAAGSPYVLEPGTVTVKSGVTLTIEPGVTVELNPKAESLQGTLSVKGAIKAVGTSA